MLALAVLALVLLLAWAAFSSWAQAFFGFQNNGGNGSHYLFWSGAGSDLAYLSVAVGALTFYRKNNCKRAWCWRIGHHEFSDPSDGVSRLLCWKHHPDVKWKALRREQIEAIQRKRHLFLGDRPGPG